MRTYPAVRCFLAITILLHAVPPPAGATQLSTAEVERSVSAALSWDKRWAPVFGQFCPNIEPGIHQVVVLSNASEGIIFLPEAPCLIKFELDKGRAIPNMPSMANAESLAMYRNPLRNSARKWGFPGSLSPQFDVANRKDDATADVPVSESHVEIHLSSGFDHVCGTPSAYDRVALRKAAVYYAKRNRPDGKEARLWIPSFCATDMTVFVVVEEPIGSRPNGIAFNRSADGTWSYNTILFPEVVKKVESLSSAPIVVRRDMTAPASGPDLR